MNKNRADISIAGESNIGLNRSRNEDNFLIYAPPGGDAVLAAVADGIGGHGKGEKASYICCRELLSAASQRDCSAWDAEFLHDVLQKANRKIFDRNIQEKRSKPMGCTVVAAIFFRDKVIFANAGDSRLYEYDPEKPLPLHQRSVDHRPQMLEGLKEKFNNVVCRALGTEIQVALELQTLCRTPRMRYLLCSDGLYSRLKNAEISRALGSEASIREITGKLMCDALLSGVRDNVTLICAGPEEAEA